ncbi:hypothetical protein ACHAPT_002791 [Fusarium lateritium]
MPTGHPYLRIPLPEDAPFELKPSPGQGWGAFATKSIKRGDLIMREEALFVIHKRAELITNADVWKAFQKLPRAQIRLFEKVRYNGGPPFTALVDAFAENSFQVGRAHGFFLVQSRFNHSCVPNSRVPGCGDEIVERYAVKDIEVGEEITFCYEPFFELKTRLERHKLLRFECCCKACKPGTAFQQLSDIRRQFIRGLEYLAYGAEVSGEQDDSDSPIIADPDLKRASENLTIPISNRFVYDLMFMTLVEQEGVLDDFLLVRASQRITSMASYFTTERNARIAKLALKQEPWLKKLDVAMLIFGAKDESDDAVNKLLREIRDIRQMDYLKEFRGISI